jgi:hypothetical protein
MRSHKAKIYMSSCSTMKFLATLMGFSSQEWEIYLMQLV